MKILKYKINHIKNGKIVRIGFFNSKKRAIEFAKHAKEIEYAGEVEVELYCENCDKDLAVGDNYIKVDEDTRYCSDCYEEYIHNLFC